MFPACENRLCISITINDNHLVERTESFNITVEKYSGIGNELTIEPSEGRIIIQDTDGGYVQRYVLLLQQHVNDNHNSRH